MLDRNIVVLGGGETHHHRHTTTVNEHRAPTDESLRLLAEMQEKTLQSLTRTPVTFGSIEGTMYAVFDPVQCCVRTIVVYHVRGQEVRVDVRGKHSDTYEQRIERIRQAVADSIAANLLQDMFDKMSPDMKRNLTEYTR